MSPWLLLGTLSARCDDALVRAAEERLAREGGTWQVDCEPDESVKITRSLGRAESRTRHVSLIGVSPALKVEVVVLASRALRVPSTSAQASAPPTPRARTSPEAEEAEAETAKVTPDPVEDAVSTALAGPPGPAPEAPATVPVDARKRPRDVVVPARETPFALALPVARAEVRAFPTEGTWLAGAGAGVAVGKMRAGIGAGYGEASTTTLDLRVLSVTFSGAYAVACFGGSTTACALVLGDVGVAWITSRADGPVTTASGTTPVLGGGAAFELARDLGPLRTAIAVTLGASAGPQAVVADQRGPAWSGVSTGTTLSVAWR
jgi:hypothetical protein